MPQISDVQVRQSLVTPSGSLVDRKGSKDGVAFADAVHGEYTVLALAGKLFYGANQAAVATTTTKNTTWTGLGIANPTNSGKILILREFSWALTVVGSAAGALSLLMTTNSGLAAVATLGPFPVGSITSGGSVAIMDDGGTVVAGTIIAPITTYGTGAITTWQGSGQQVAKLNGRILIYPGYAVLTDTTTVLTTGPIFGFLWEEVDLY